MSADLMIISKNDESHFKGRGAAKAFFIDETSMGEPHYEFGEWFNKNFNQGISVLEKLLVYNETDHDFSDKFTEKDYNMCCHALDDHTQHPKLNKEELLEYLKNHIGDYLSTECW